MKRRFSELSSCFCLIAAFFLTLTPVLHSLHLASCSHFRALCSNSHNITYTWNKADKDPEIQVSFRAGSKREEKKHEHPSCFICQFFMLSGHGSLWSQPLAPDAVVFSTDILLSFNLHVISDIFACDVFSRGPPVCSVN